MNAAKHAIKFFSMRDGFRGLLIESFLYLAWARFLIALPFTKVAPSLGSPMEETSYEPVAADRNELKKISTAIHMVSRHTLWDSKCLVRAIAGMKMLERRRIESTLYLGTAKDKNGEMIAHAWLRSGTFYMTGAEEMRKFTVVGKFAKSINHEGLEGWNDG